MTPVLFINLKDNVPWFSMALALYSGLLLKLNTSQTVASSDCLESLLREIQNSSYMI